MSVLHSSSIRPFLIFRPRHHVFPNASSSKRKTALLPNDGVLPIAGTFTECFEENLLLNGVSLPNSAHKLVSFLYQFLVLTDTRFETSLFVSPLLRDPARLRHFVSTLHLHQRKSSCSLHLQYSARSQSTPRCQSLITLGSDHSLILRRSGPHLATVRSFYHIVHSTKHKRNNPNYLGHR
jgi:hypothetical protein